MYYIFGLEIVVWEIRNIILFALVFQTYHTFTRNQQAILHACPVITQTTWIVGWKPNHSKPLTDQASTLDTSPAKITQPNSPQASQRPMKTAPPWSRLQVRLEWPPAVKSSLTNTLLWSGQLLKALVAFSCHQSNISKGPNPKSVSEKLEPHFCWYASKQLVWPGVKGESSILWTGAGNSS